MSSQHTLRLLVVEDSFEDERFIRELLEEAAECRVWPQWLIWEPVFVDTAAEACELAIDGIFDAILLNLSLPDSRVLHETFTAVAGIAPLVPILVLADEPDESLETFVLREGAQDFLVKSQTDAEPLSRALKHAIERQRHVNSLLPNDLVSVGELPVPETGCESALPLDLIAISDLSMAE